MMLVTKRKVVIYLTIHNLFDTFDTTSKFLFSDWKIRRICFSIHDNRIMFKITNRIYHILNRSMTVDNVLNVLDFFNVIFLLTNWK